MEFIFYLLVTATFSAEREVPAEAGIAEARLERGRAGAKAQSHRYGAADQVFLFVIFCTYYSFVPVCI